MGKSVWVIEHGQYSDYSVIGVYTTKEKAQLVCDTINKDIIYDEATIAEWPLDPAADELANGMSRYYVSMRWDGTTDEVTRGEVHYYDLDDETRAYQRFDHKDRKVLGKTFTMWARDEKHAIKIANERRTRLISEGGWDYQAGI